MDREACRQFLELERTHWWFEGRRRIFFHVLERFIDRRDLRIVDVGCGVGGMMEGLSRFGHPCGIDVENEMLSICQERGFDALKASGTELPIRDGRVDLVTFFDCIEHIEDDVGTLRDTCRALSPGGHVFISVPAYQFLYANNDRVAHHKRRYTLGELRRKVRSAGFEIKRSSHINVLLFPLILPAVLLLKAKEAVFGVSDGTTNLTYTYPRWLHRVLSSLFSVERHLVARLSLPVGHSICLLARKPLSSQMRVDNPPGAAAHDGHERQSLTA